MFFRRTRRVLLLLDLSLIFCCSFTILSALTLCANAAAPDPKAELSKPPVSQNLSTLHEENTHPKAKGKEKKKDVDCDVVIRQFTPNTSKANACDAISANDNCQETDSYGNYISFLYCTLPGAERLWSILGGIILVSFLKQQCSSFGKSSSKTALKTSFLPKRISIQIIYMIFLFVIVGIAADDFFCPALEVITELLHLSQNIAGVTFLAFGNGAPDIFSSLAGVNAAITADPTLSMAALLGGGFFVSSVVAGAVYIFGPPFHISERPFLRDMTFYLGAVIWLMFVLWRGSISQLEAIMFLVAYAVYAILVVVGRLVWVKWLREKDASSGNDENTNSMDEGRLTNGNDSRTKSLEEEEQEREDERRAVQQLRRPRTMFGESISGSHMGSFRHSIPRHHTVQRHRSNHEHHRRRLSALSAQIQLTTPPVSVQIPYRVGCVVINSSGLSTSSDKNRRASLPIISSTTNSAIFDRRHMELLLTTSAKHKQELEEEEQQQQSSNSLAPTILVIPATPEVQNYFDNFGIDSAASYYYHDDEPQASSTSENPVPNGKHGGSLRRRPSSTRAQHHLSVPVISDRDLSPPPRPDNELAEISASNDESENDAAQTDRALSTPWWLDVLEHIWPMTASYWKTLRWYGRIWAVIKIPVQVALLITIPLVDPAEPRTRNWCKWLQVFQTAVSPVLCVIACVGITDKIAFGVAPLCAAVAVVSFILAVLLAIFTRRDRVPRYHSFFSLVGFAVAIVWIYKTANEVVAVLTALGINFHVSTALLGLTILAWSNSLGDLIVDTTLARQGFPNIGISAAYAGPLFNILVGMGLSFTVVTSQIPERVIKFHAGPELIMLCFGLLLVQVLTIVGIPLQRFQARKLFGIGLIGLYFVLLVMIILTELGVLAIKFPNR